MSSPKPLGSLANFMGGGSLGCRSCACSDHYWRIFPLSWSWWISRCVWHRSVRGSPAGYIRRTRSCCVLLLWNFCVHPGKAIAQTLPCCALLWTPHPWGRNCRRAFKFIPPRTFDYSPYTSDHMPDTWSPYVKGNRCTLNNRCGPRPYRAHAFCFSCTASKSKKMYLP